MSLQYLIDTDWVIHYLHAHAAIVARLDELQPQGLALSIISLAELSEGVFYSRDPEGDREFSTRKWGFLPNPPIGYIPRIRDRHELRSTETGQPLNHHMPLRFLIFALSRHGYCHQQSLDSKGLLSRKQSH